MQIYHGLLNRLSGSRHLDAAFALLQAVKQVSVVCRVCILDPHLNTWIFFFLILQKL